MDFNKLIQTGENFARIEFIYNGLPETGMMAWLDSSEIKTWWRADDAIVEPFVGGRFYVVWDEGDRGRQHAICGVIKLIDTDTDHIQVSKIFYMSPAGKLGPIELDIRFERTGGNETKFLLCHTHEHKGQLHKLYDASVFASWPATFGLMKKYLEGNCVNQ